GSASASSPSSSPSPSSPLSGPKNATPSSRSPPPASDTRGPRSRFAIVSTLLYCRQQRGTRCPPHRPGPGATKGVPPPRSQDRILSASLSLPDPLLYSCFLSRGDDPL